MAKRGTPGTFSLTDLYRRGTRYDQRSSTNILEDAAALFRNSFGIDLVMGPPEQPVPYNAILSTEAAQSSAAQLPVINARTPRTLWILAAARFVLANRTPPISGWDGNSLASIARSVYDDELAALAPSLQGVPAVQTSGPNAGNRDPNAVVGWVNSPSPADRPLLDFLARVMPPERFVAAMAFRTLVHEIGHAFKLVPNNEESGRSGGDPGWLDQRGGTGRHDPNAPRAVIGAQPTSMGHCADHSCIMFFEGDAFLYRQLIEAGDSQPTLFAGGNQQRCSLFLRTCDLSDLRV